MSSSSDHDHAAPPPMFQKIVSALDNAALCFAFAVGSRLGLFTKLKELGPRKTSAEIAAAAGLSERYVREWLAILVVMDVAHYEDTGKTYTIHDKDLEVLIPGASPITFSEGFASLAGVFEPLCGAFKTGKGIPYSYYTTFSDLMNRMSAPFCTDRLDQVFIPSIEGLREKLESGIQVADIGCGQGLALRVLAQKYPKSTFVGIDLLEGALEVARAEASKLNLSNLTYRAVDCAKLADEKDLIGKFDHIFTIDAIHDQGRPDLALAGIKELLKTDGRYSMLEPAACSHLLDQKKDVLAASFYCVSLMHCMPASLAQEGGLGLGAAWGKELAQEYLEKAGFKIIRIENCPGDERNHHFLCGK